MISYRFIRAVIFLTATSSAIQVSAINASETNAIESLRFDPAEMHFGDLSKIELVPAEKLGGMPVPILDDSGNGFVKILMPDGTEGWINRSDVQIGGVETQAICAKTRVYAQASDRRSAHLRGISRDCK